MNRIATTSPRTAALIAGVGYLVIFFLAIFANFVVLTGLVDPDDPGATFSAIADSESLFRLGIVAFLVVFVVDVVIAWALYVLFREVSTEVSLITAWFRLVYTAFLGVGLVFLLVVVELVSGAGYLGVFEQGQLDAQVTLMLGAFDVTWLIGLVAFGIHLMLLAYLLRAARVGPRFLPVVLMLAGAAYVLDTLAHVVLSAYADYAGTFLLIVAVPSVIGELSFAVWLLARGGKQPVALRQPEGAARAAVDAAVTG